MTKQNQQKLDVLEMKLDQLKEKIESIEKILLNQNCTNDVMNLLTNLVSKQMMNNQSIQQQDSNSVDNKKKGSQEMQCKNIDEFINEFIPRRFSTIV